MYIPFQLGSADGSLLVSAVHRNDSFTHEVIVLHLRYFSGDMDSDGMRTEAYHEYLRGFRFGVAPWLLSKGTDGEGHIASFGFEDGLSVFLEAGEYVWYHENTVIFRYPVE